MLAAAQRALGATPPLLQLSLLGALGLVLAGIALLLLRRRVGESFGHRAVAAPPTDAGDPG